MRKKTGQNLLALTSMSSVELPGIETDSLPGNLASDLTVRFDSVQFSTARYLRFRFGVLTASRVTPVPGHGGSHLCRWPESIRPRCIGMSAASRRVVGRSRSWPGHLANAAVYINYRNIKGDPL